jgi:hypothetical protein
MLLVLGPEAIAELCLTRAEDFAHSGTMELFAEAGLGYAGLLGAIGVVHKVGAYHFFMACCRMLFVLTASASPDAIRTRVQSRNNDQDKRNPVGKL